MNNKSELRKRAKLIRKNLDINSMSEQIVFKIKNFEDFKKSKNIMLFYPLEFEIDILKLLDFEEKNFYLPRIKGLELECCPYKKGDLLRDSEFKTKEPVTESVNPEILDLIFVPALMADKNNYRLGYGKGYYDRFLEKTNAITVVPLAKELIAENLPIEEYDKKIDFIITQ